LGQVSALNRGLADQKRIGRLLLLHHLSIAAEYHAEDQRTQAELTEFVPHTSPLVEMSPRMHAKQPNSTRTVFLR
jgi:hypothetical protein